MDGWIKQIDGWLVGRKKIYMKTIDGWLDGWIETIDGWLD